jgi:hypothetical protein
MLVKLLVTVGSAIAVWLFWRLVNGAAATVIRRATEKPDDGPADDGRTISLVKDPETGEYRPREDEPRR